MTITAADIALFRQAFIFMRHGESEANLADTMAGSLDVALTARGRAQAQAAAALLKDSGISAIYSSTLSRARDTAAYAAALLGLPVIEIAEIGERNWGEAEGKPRAQIRRDLTPAGGETPQQFAERVLRGCAQIEARGLPLLVAHAGVFRVLCRALGLHEPDQPYFNAAPVRIEPAGSAWHMLPIGNAGAPI
jgi:probable phosphoglycerate mutase